MVLEEEQFEGMTKSGREHGKVKRVKGVRDQIASDRNSIQTSLFKNNVSGHMAVRSKVASGTAGSRGSIHVLRYLFLHFGF